MSRRGKSTKGCNDHDLVHPTVYRPTSRTSLPPQYDNITPNPAFTPMKMDPIVNPGPILPDGFDSEDPEALFRLLFDDRILDRIVRCTNLNAASIQHKRAWKPVSKKISYPI
jgi:Transposase IS4